MLFYKKTDYNYQIFQIKIEENQTNILKFSFLSYNKNNIIKRPSSFTKIITKNNETNHYETQRMYIEIIKKICDLLKIKHQINFDNPPFNIILYIHTESDFSIDDDLNEFTPLYNKKNFLYLGKDFEVNDKNYTKFLNNDKNVTNVNNVSNIFSFKSVSVVTNNKMENSFNKENKFKRKIKNKNLLRSLIKNTENLYDNFYGNIINQGIINNNDKENFFLSNKKKFLNQPKNLMNQFYESKSFNMKERNDFLSKNSLYSINNKNFNNDNNNDNYNNNEHYFEEDILLYNKDKKLIDEMNDFINNGENENIFKKCFN
jgi:hypothetical protein